MERTEEASQNLEAGEPLPREVEAVLNALERARNQRSVSLPLEQLEQLENQLRGARRQIEELRDIKEPRLIMEFRVTSKPHSNAFDVPWMFNVPESLQYGYTRISIKDLSEHEGYNWIYEKMLDQVKILRQGEDNIKAMVIGLNKAHKRVNEQIDRQPWYLRWLYRKWAVPPDDEQGKA